MSDDNVDRAGVATRTIYFGYFNDGPRLFSTRERAEFYSQPPPKEISHLRVVESVETEERYRDVIAREAAEDRRLDESFEKWLALARETEQKIRRGLIQ
jgi:hypothetical protein